MHGSQTAEEQGYACITYTIEKCATHLVITSVIVSNESLLFIKIEKGIDYIWLVMPGNLCRPKRGKYNYYLRLKTFRSAAL